MSYFGNTAVVGDWNRGVAYVFQEDKFDRTWRQEAKLGDNITTHYFLGFSVDIDDRGDNIVAGDWLAGTTFLFHQSRNHDGSKGHSRWIPKLLVSSGRFSASSVAISGDGDTIISSYYGSTPCVLEDGSSNSCNVAYVLNRR